jgi:multicomponent Na+:H+ antiporter subunit D
VTSHLPALVVVVPLLTAPMCVLVRHRRTARWGAVAMCWLTFAMAVALLQQVLAEGPISYWMGGWEPPWGIEYRIDVLNGSVLCLVSAMAAIVMPFGPGRSNVNLPEDRKHLFYAAFMLCLTGLLGMAATGDAFNVFVFLEISSLATYALVAMGDDRRALTAAFRYLVIGTIGGTFYLIGVGLLYMMTGTLNMADLATLLPAVAETRTVRVALAFLVVGLSIKLALFPLHQWLPNAYAYAPSMVTAFVASTATKVSYYALLRVVFTIFGASVVFGMHHLDRVLLPMALVGIFVGSAVAVFESDVKRLLAYSSVAQVGYMVLGLSFGSLTGLTGGIVHMFNHAMMKGALFLAVGAVVWRVGGSSLTDFRGLGKAMPKTMAAFVLAGLSLIGVPLTAGFVSKWYLVLAALEAGQLWVACAVLASSLMAVVYIGKVVEVAYFEERPQGAPEVLEAPLGMLLPTWLLVMASLVAGVYTPWTAGIARRAAEALLGGVS